jgi:hypothetical protein
VRLARFLETWRGLTLENRFHRVVLLGLVASNLVSAVALLHAERTVVLVPPGLEGPVEVARESAAREVKEAWALYLAELLGNVSPANAEFLLRPCGPGSGRATSGRRCSRARSSPWLAWSSPCSASSPRVRVRAHAASGCCTIS